MAQECELLANCGFFKAHQASNDLACKGFIKQYCRGPLMNQCKRKEYRQKNGVAPADNMMPNGALLTPQ